MLSFKKSPNGHYIVITETGNKYAWNIGDNMFDDMTTTHGFKIRILHNFENKAMIDVFDDISNNGVYRAEINPLRHADVEEWVVDDQV